MVEHMNHAATENGCLRATYDQLVAWGLTRSEIRAAIEEGDFLGLIRYERGGRWAGSNQPSTYRLTFYADREDNSPTNEWKGKTEGAIAEWRRDRATRKRARRERRRKQIPGSGFRSTVVQLAEPGRVKTGEGNDERP